MNYVLFCSMCGAKAVMGLKNKSCRALCAKHLGMARFLDAIIEERTSDMPLDPVSYSSEATRAH